MQANILNNETTEAYATEERCTIREWSNDSGDPALSVAEAEVDRGVTTAWHRLHGVAERYVILDGEGVVEVGSLEARRVVPGDVVRIPPGERQRIRNSGARPLRFLALCTPRFTPACYESLEA